MAKFMGWLSGRKIALEIPKEQVLNAVESAKELKSFIEAFPETDAAAKKLKMQIFRKNKEEAKKLYIDANREGKNSNDDLPRKLYELSCIVNNCALSFMALGISRIDDYIKKLAEILNNCIAEIDKCAQNKDNCRESCEKLHKLEENADDTYNEAVSELFHFFKNSLDVMKHREIYRMLEEAIDKSEEIAFLIERNF